MLCENITTFTIQEKTHKSVVFGSDCIQTSYNFNSWYTSVAYTNFL